MDNAQIIEEKLKNFRGRQLPVLRWENHQEMMYNYDPTNKIIIVEECGVFVNFDHDAEKLTNKQIRNALEELEEKVKEYYLINHGFHLYEIEY